MKRLVDGVEVELATGATNISKDGDRIWVESDGRKYSALAVRVGDAVLVSYRGNQYRVEPVRAKRGVSAKDHSGDLVSPMPGAVVDVLAAVGQTVKKGEKVVILEAMKTQQTFSAPFEGTVARVNVEKGQQVGEGVVLAVIEPIVEQP